MSPFITKKKKMLSQNEALKGLGQALKYWPGKPDKQSRRPSLNLFLIDVFIILNLST